MKGFLLYMVVVAATTLFFFLSLAQVIKPYGA